MQCQAKTLKGTQCSRKAISGSQFCTQHKGSLSKVEVAEENKNVIQNQVTIPEVEIQEEKKNVVVVEKTINLEESQNPKNIELILDGFLDLEAFEEVDFTTGEDADLANEDFLNDTDLLETVVGKGGVLLLLRVGGSEITIDKSIYYDDTWEQITIGELVDTILAEYEKPVTTELKDLEKKAIELNMVDEFMEDYGSLIGEDNLHLYDLNLGYLRFIELEKVQEGVYRAVMDYID